MTTIFYIYRIDVPQNYWYSLVDYCENKGWEIEDDFMTFESIGHAPLNVGDKCFVTSDLDYYVSEKTFEIDSNQLNLKLKHINL